MRRKGFTVIEGVVVLGLVLLLVTALASWRKNEQLLQTTAERRVVSQQTVQTVWGLFKNDVERSDRCLETFGQWSANHQILILNQPQHDASGFPSPYGKVVVYVLSGNRLIRITPQQTRTLATLSGENHVLYYREEGSALAETAVSKARQVEVALGFDRRSAQVRRFRLSGSE